METTRQSSAVDDSELLAAVRRLLSPDTQIEVLATISEFLRVQEVLEEEHVEFPRLEYDGDPKVAIVVAAPSPFHGEMVWCLTGRILSTVNDLPGQDANIKNYIDLSSERSNLTNSGDTFITRNWDGAIRYRSLEGHTKTIAVEVGVSQTYESLRAAISYSVSALRCSLGFAMCISDGNRRSARSFFETFRKSDEICLPNTLLDPTQSFVTGDCRRREIYWGNCSAKPGGVDSLGDCIPAHIVTGNSIKATHINFLEEEWFKESIQIAILETVVERFSDKNRVQPA
ncbi:hypothetical protein V1527DRAFT_503661 [Lipomyces starkeyi]